MLRDAHNPKATIVQFGHSAGTYWVICSRCGAGGPGGCTELWAMSQAKADGWVFEEGTLKPYCPDCKPILWDKRRQKKGGVS